MNCFSYSYGIHESELNINKMAKEQFDLLFLIFGTMLLFVVWFV